MPKTAFDKMRFSKKEFAVLTKLMLDLDFSDIVQRIDCSPLIICGMDDKANIAAAKGLTIKIPTAKLHLIENAGHEDNIDVPEELEITFKHFFHL